MKPYFATPKLKTRPYAGEEGPQGRGTKPGVEVMADFIFVCSKGWQWTAHERDIVDGASIPWPLVPFVSFPATGGRYQEFYFPATVLHDVYCRDRSRSKADTDRMFREAMITNAVLVPKAWTMWLAVVMFGPQW